MFLQTSSMTHTQKQKIMDTQKRREERSNQQIGMLTTLRSGKGGMYYIVESFLCNCELLSYPMEVLIFMLLDVTFQMCSVVR